MTPAVIASSSSPAGAPGWAERLRSSKALIPVLAVLSLSTVALATALVVGRSDAGNAAPSGALAAPPSASTAPAQIPPPDMVQAPQAMAAPGAGAPVRPQPVPQGVARPGVAGGVQTPVAQPAPAACAHCGVVESVVAVQHSAPTSGVGAVAGGVLGGLLGNQMGHGTGRAAMTVLGAVGGGYAGNAIEGNMKRTTSYQVRVRMQDGHLRTVDQAQPPSVGTPVAIEGRTLRVLPPQGMPVNAGGV